MCWWYKVIVCAEEEMKPLISVKGPYVCSLQYNHTVLVSAVISDYSLAARREDETDLRIDVAAVASRKLVHGTSSQI